MNISQRGDVDANEIDPPIGHQGQPFIAVHEQLTHRERSGALRLDLLKPGHVLWRKCIFQEEQPVRLQCLGKYQRLGGRNALVNVVDEVYFEADFLAEVVEHPDRVIDVRGRLKHRRGSDAARACLLHLVRSGSGHSITGEAGDSQLHPNVPVAARHGLAHLVLKVRQFPRAGVGIERHRRTDFPAE